jgi:hypothetical protein
MTYISSCSLRFGVLTLVAVLTSGICSEAFAKAHKERLHARRSISESHAQLVEQQPARLGAMRYYGGPKSPMWRGPSEN